MLPDGLSGYLVKAGAPDGRMKEVADATSQYEHYCTEQSLIMIVCRVAR
jgi:hypothetical protein